MSQSTNPYSSPAVQEPSPAEASPRESSAPDDGRPPLFQDAGFWGITFTQFLGAFNDNVFKQLMLLLAVPIAGLAAAEDQQGLATIVFSVPFILFSGFAGFLSDKNPKRPIIIASKVAEIVIMLLGMLAFIAYPVTGYTGLLIVLFLMGAQSSFFGPGKFGILPEMLRDDDLPRANGVIVMSTFLAIIFGTAIAGLLGDIFVIENPDGSRDTGRMWIGSLVCVTIAVAGTVSAWFVRKTPPAEPDLKLALESFAAPHSTRKMLWLDWPLFSTLLALSVFWMISSLVMQSVNSLGIVQLGLSKFATSILTASIGVGIGVGAVAAGRLTHGDSDFHLVRKASWAMVVLMLVIGFGLPVGHPMLGFWLSLPVLVMLGAAAGAYAIPLQVFMQARPPATQKGRVIAVVNQLNFTGIMLSGVVYKAFDRVIEAQSWSRSYLFVLTAGLMLPLAAAFRPKDHPPEIDYGDLNA